MTFAWWLRTICRGFAALSAASLFAVWASAAEYRFGDQTLSVPDDFVVELAAGPGLVDRPITCDFDEQGRLYVADSSGSNDPVNKQLAERPHRIVRLEDTDGDGKFDKRTVFADKLMFPEGTMWFRGSLYVSAPPSIWKLTDTDGDGVADRREEWFKGKTLTGCANDLHGPYRGRDGWIYWCKGAFAEQTYDLPGKKDWKTRAAHIFRARPDGSGTEPVMTGGMDNPVDVVITPDGERIVCGTFFQNPGGGRRDGLIHAIYGGVYGKDHAVLAGHPRTGDLMPIMTHLGPAAPCGLHLVDDGLNFPSVVIDKVARPQLLCCQFNLRKVSRHALVRHGASYTTVDSDFLVSDSMDFHPTDVIQDADESILVCDTGGWYKLCCPTSQFHKPEVLGAVYRIRLKTAEKPADPRGRAIDWKNESSERLAMIHANSNLPAVRDRAIEMLAARGPAALDAISMAMRDKNSSSARQIAMIWTLCRIDSPKARELTREALDRGVFSEATTLAAIHSIALWRDRQAVELLAEMLNAESLALRRAAAEALGRIGDPSVADLLIARMADTTDRVLEHSLIYAVIELEAKDAARRALVATDDRIKRSALLALEAIPSGGLRVEDVIPLLSSTDTPLREAAWHVAEAHANWGGELAGFLEQRLRDVKNDADSATLSTRLAQFAGQSTVQDLLARVARDPKQPEQVRRTALAAIGAARIKPLPDAWFATLSDMLKGESLIAESVAAFRTQSLSKQQASAAIPILMQVAADVRQPADLRLRAVDAISGDIPGLSDAVFALSREQLRPSDATLARSTAVGILARAKLSREQLLAVAADMKSLGPFEITRLLPLYDASGDDRALAALIGALESSPGAASLSAASLRPLVEKLPAAIKPRGEKLLAKIDASLADQKAQLEAIVAELAGGKLKGDVQRGRALFHGKRATCVSCHAVAYVGGQIGPDLTRIGQIRTERDLIESIVFPSASFVRSYEPVMIATTDGQRHSGLVRRDTPEEVVLTVAADKEVRIAREEIEEIRPGTVSIMPQGLDRTLSRQELADLVAFLKNNR